MKNLWEVWKQALSPEQCDFIVAEARTRPAQEASIGFDREVQTGSGHRSSVVRWLDVFDQDRDIADMLMHLVEQSNRNNFGFDLRRMNEIQFTEYQGSGGHKYDWHHDVYWENPAPFDRKLSIVVQLSDPGDYDGGRFEFFGCASPGEEFMLQGSALIFPSFFPHRVLPVTSGVRHSLVSWVEGPKFR